MEREIEGEKESVSHTPTPPATTVLLTGAVTMYTCLILDKLKEEKGEGEG